MGATRKSTPERLDRLIQFIWDFQQKHDGETPSQALLAKHNDIGASGVGYWINLLVDQRRLHKISVRPFRATIKDHPQNTTAIDRFKHIRERVETLHAEERERIREGPAASADVAEVAQDKEAVFASMPPRTAPSSTTVPQPQPCAAPVVEKYTVARAALVAAQKEVKAAMPQMLKIAESRDLVHELVERGYIVSKQR